MARLAIGVWLLLVMAEYYAVSGRTAQRSERNPRLVSVPPLAGLDPRVIDVLTLGFRGVYDDLAAIWVGQFQMDSRVFQDPDALFAAMHAVSHTQVKIESFYTLSCFLLWYDMRRPDFCEPLSLDGMKALPSSWRIPMTQGYVEASKLGDQKKAALYYRLASSRPGVPSYIGDLALKLEHDIALTPEDLQKTRDQLFPPGEGAGVSVFPKEPQP